MTKRVFYILILVFIPLKIQSQDLIKGLLFISESFKNRFPKVYVSIEGFTQRKLVDQNGFFELKTEKEQDEYLMNFEVNETLFKTYIYKDIWRMRKRPKRISFSRKCIIDRQKALQDQKKNEQKLYVFQTEKLPPEDLNVQLEYNFTYVLVNTDEIHNFDCYKKYNDRIFKCLVLSKDVSKYIINKNTIGLDEANISGPCLR
ncbi:hypothetical protein [uncultured Tenacibaculum sp.]|uniref:hypothetical protein n=1 Tax=uncultured Tenacibaculum sp. TaxID=174713 RepID=UPI002622F451|nr:hypothetical protein [uncultured Tenacibaculum sp.]